MRAAFYLKQVPEGALEEADRYRALRDLSDAQYFLGRIEAAMETARRLEQAARGQDRGWQMVGVGQRARLLTDKGQVDETLKLHKEELAVYEALGARRSRAITLGDIAQIHLSRKEVAKAVPMLRESYEIALMLGDAFGTAFVGRALARMLLQTGAKKEAEPVVARAAEALTKIGKAADAEALRALLRATGTH